jgi:glucose-1-phosphate thymidylyltransferase
MAPLLPERSGAFVFIRLQYYRNVPASTAACYIPNVKGVVLAGGTGSRLFPLTKITNKHLLPIYDKPMIYYPIQTLVDAGIKEILVVTGGRNSGDFLRLLANGREFGLKHLDYTYQEGEGGIADALALAEHFADGQKICVVLGDNIIEGTVREAVEDFKHQPSGAKILLKEVSDAERFGVAELRDGRIVGIEEKPKRPKSNYAVTGIYMYDETVFEKVRVLVPSGRGELEITDVNNAYIREGSMSYAYLNGWWTDAGTFESLLRAANLVAETRAKNTETVLVKP